MLKKAIFFFAFFLILGICCSASHAQTVNAASCNTSDVQKALNSVNQATASVVIPSGTCSWSSAISYTVPSVNTSLTIEGQTQVNCSGSPGTSSYACTATDTTVIQDSYQAACCSNQLIIISTNGASSVFRVTGITFEGGNIGSVNNNKQPVIQFSGGSQNFRIDHCHFNWNTYSPQGGMAWVRFYGGIEGVLDHNLVDLGNDASVANGFQADQYIGDNIGEGDGTYKAATAWGTQAFLFMEDNVFNGGAPNDCADAGSFVMRYNNINSAYIGIQNHATKSDAGAFRGCRAFEAYHNYFSGSPAIGTGLSGIGMKGSTALIWGNTLASGYNELVDVQTDRNSGATTETPTPNGWGYCGTNNPNNTARLASPWDGNASATGWPCLDGVGRGQTQQALNGANFPGLLDSVLNIIAWPQQYLEPVYIWMNTIQNGGNNTIIGGSDTDIEFNRDVYYDNGSFNGSSGTGYGALASRPASCTAGPGGTYAQSPTGSYGVGYWATDTNTFYVCTSGNTWTAIYTPYTYPHPLDGGTAPSTGSSGPSSSAPAPPTGLSATVQ